MAQTLPKTCAMGSNKTGLVGTIGVTLLNPDGTTHTARATADIYEIGGGCYGKEIAFPDNWSGSLKWDTGGGSPAYATEEYNIEGLVDMIEEDTSKMNFTGTDIKATLDSEEVTTDAASRTASKATGFATQNPPSLNLNDYKADVSNLDVAVSTRNATTPPTVAEVRTEMEGIGTKLTAVKGQTDRLQFAVGNDIKATLDGEEVITDVASRNASKADVSNLDVAVSTRSAHADPTPAIKGIPGKTNQEVFDNEKGTDGAYTGTPPTVDEIRTELEQVGTKISDIKTQTDKMQFSASDDIKATLDGEVVTLNATTEAQLNTIEEEVKRTLGLVHENIYIDLPGYDTNKNLVSARLRIYSVPGSVGTASDVIAAYTITAVGAGKGKFTSWKMVKQ